MKAVAVLLSLLAVSGCGGPARLDPFIYLPTKVDAYRLDPSGSTPEETVTADRIQELRLTTRDGETLGAVWVTAGASAPPRGYLIFFHGKGGNLDTTMGRLKRYANLGFHVLGFDYRGFGVSTGTPSEPGIDLDGYAVVEEVKRRAGSLDRVVYAGQSLGCAPAAQRAANEPARALIIESGFASLEAIKTDSTQMDFPQSFISDDRWDTAARLRALTVPVLILHGSEDEVIRAHHAYLNDAAAHEPKRFEMVEGGGHSNLPTFMGTGYQDLIHGFVAQYVPPEG